MQIFSAKHIQFIAKNTFKVTCFGSTEPSAGLFVRTDPYPITRTFGIPSVYNYGIFNAYTVLHTYTIIATLVVPNVLVIGHAFVLTKRPADGSVEPKHVALNVFLAINWTCLTKKNLHFVYIQEHIGMTNVKNSHLCLGPSSGLFPSCFLSTRARRVLRLRIKERPTVWMVAANILSKKSRIADKGWSPILGVGRGVNNSSP